MAGALPPKTVLRATVADDAGPLSALIAEEHPIQQFREVQLDLEETFMSITKATKDEEAARSEQVATAEAAE